MPLQHIWLKQKLSKQKQMGRKCLIYLFTVFPDLFKYVQKQIHQSTKLDNKETKWN